jgi:serine/threonine-protein kinase
MSPEQARGDVVDGRSDLFSFGVMLYELAAGALPFSGPTSAVVFEGILARAPRPPEDLAPALPAAFSQIVLRALEKDRDVRYQTAAEIGADLRRLERGTESGVAAAVQRGSGTRVRRRWPRGVAAGVAAACALALGVVGVMRARVPRAIDSIAVLPFINSEADAEIEYLSEGLTNTLINSLARLHTVRIVPRTLVARYKNRIVEPQQIARELDVRAVVTGRLSQHGDTLNIQAELVDTSNASQLWGEQYHRGMADVLGVEEEILRGIVDNIRAVRSNGPELRQDTRNTEAYRLYLKGWYYWNRRTADDTSRAIDLFQRSIAADPSYALAYAGLADAYVLADYLPAAESLGQAKAAAEKALALDDNIAEAHASLALVSQREGNWTGAGQEFQRAIARNPSYATAHHWYGQYLLHVKRPQEALREARTAQRLDPLSLTIGTDVGLANAFSRQYSAALEEYAKVLEMDPTFVRAIRWSGVALEQEHRYDEAIAAFERASALDPKSSVNVAALAHAAAAAGDRRQALRLLSELLARSKRTYVPAIDIAIAQIGVANRDTAFEWLQRAFDDGSIWNAWIDLDPRYDELRSDPRFDNLLERLGLPR